MQGEVPGEGPIYKEGDIYRLRKKSSLPNFASEHALFSRRDIQDILTVTENNDMVSALFEDLAIGITINRELVNFHTITSALKYVVDAVKDDSASPLRVQVIGRKLASSEYGGGYGAMLITKPEKATKAFVCCMLGCDPAYNNVFASNNSAVIFGTENLITPTKETKVAAILHNIFDLLPREKRQLYKNIMTIESTIEEMMLQGTLFGVLQTLVDTNDLRKKS